MPRVIINDIETEVPAGTSALDAVFHAGFDVPYFCSNQYLSPIGACRLCLVEAGSPRKNPDGTWIMENGQPKIFYFPKPVASCTLMVSDGMVIRSNSESVKKAQAGMMEFTLLNHPLDCPTCDKGGACELQDRAFEYGYGEARFEFTRRHADKHHALSEFIVLDKERCIHCKRCVRYFEEIPGQEVLDFIERGSHTFIDSFESSDLAGRDLGNFSGNITDICPVGALLDNVSRFRGRNWEYSHTQSTCTVCSVGCSIQIDSRTDRLERIRSGENPEINEIWLCDAGRFGHEWVDDRIRQPMVRKNGELVQVSMEEAIQAIQDGLKNINKQEIGIYTNADITLEEALTLEQMAKVLGTPHVDHFPRYSVALSSVERPTLDEIARSDFILVIGADVSEEAPIVDLRIQESLKGVVSDLAYYHGPALADLRLQERMPRKRERLAVFAPIKVRLFDHAGISQTYQVGQELELMRQIADLKKNPDNQSMDSLKKVAKNLSEAKNPIIILGAFALNNPEAEQILITARHLAKKILPIPASSNAGLEFCDIVPAKNAGSFPNVGRIRAAFVSGLNIPRKKLDFLVVHTDKIDHTVEADVVLPKLTNYEKQGTTMNLEGRLLNINPAPLNSKNATDLSGLLRILAQATTTKFDVKLDKIFNERFGFDKVAKNHLLAKKPKTFTSVLQPVTARIVEQDANNNAILLTTCAWNEKMLESELVKSAIGLDLLQVSQELADRFNIKDQQKVKISVNHHERQAIVSVKSDPGFVMNTLPALKTELAGSFVEIDYIKSIEN